MKCWFLGRKNVCSFDVLFNTHVYKFGIGWGHQMSKRVLKDVCSIFSWYAFILVPHLYISMLISENVSAVQMSKNQYWALTMNGWGQKGAGLNTVGPSHFEGERSNHWVTPVGQPLWRSNYVSIHFNVRYNDIWFMKHCEWKSKMLQVPISPLYVFMK